jgi:hypothetical protein
MRRLALLALTILAAFPLSSAARACEVAPGYTMEILVDGRPLSLLTGNGSTYVEAAKNREYSIRLTNRSAARVAVALSVDGLNVIDAKRTSAREARKWILDPWQTITLDGWQVSSESARRFVFTTEDKSYGAWLGRTGDLGVVSAAFFREKARPIAPAAPIEKQRSADAPAPSGERPTIQSEAEGRFKKDEYAATGIGREVNHRVVEVDFDEEATPARVLTYRYEYRDALVRLGVLPDDRPLARRERATGFAPDPYAR